MDPFDYLMTCFEMLTPPIAALTGDGTNLTFLQCTSKMITVTATDRASDKASDGAQQHESASQPDDLLIRNELDNIIFNNHGDEVIDGDVAVFYEISDSPSLSWSQARWAYPGCDSAGDSSCSVFITGKSPMRNHDDDSASAASPFEWDHHAAAATLDDDDDGVPQLAWNASDLSKKRKTPSSRPSSCPMRYSDRQSSSRILLSSSTCILRAWMMSAEHYDHPYPNNTERHQLAADAGISSKQLRTWFTNARKRIWLPMRKKQVRSKSQ